MRIEIEHAVGQAVAAMFSEGLSARDAACEYCVSEERVAAGYALVVAAVASLPMRAPAAGVVQVGSVAFCVGR